MAPQNNKRAVSVPCKEARSPAKKAKAQAHEKIVDPLAQQLAPIFAALAASEKTAASCDTLQAALPHCLTGAKEECHSFQIKILDLTTTALKSLEEDARTALAEAEVAAEKLRTDSASTQADFESKQLAAKAAKEACEAKTLEIEKFGKDVDAAKDEVKAEIAKKDAFLATKATLSSDQEDFQKTLEELWQPLKACTFLSQQWRKRDKSCTELIEKITPLSLEESLVEALKATLKLKVEQRCAFAQRTLAVAEEAFTKHQALLADRIAGAAGEEAAREAAVAAAEAKLVVEQGKLAEQDNQDIELQNVWADLETKSGEAKSSVEALNADLQDSVEEVATCKATVEAALAHSASFAVLCEPPAPQPMVTEEEVEVTPASILETEAAEAVAVAA